MYLDNIKCLMMMYMTMNLLDMCQSSGHFQLVIKTLHLSAQCPLVFSLCLKEHQPNPSQTGDCSYGNMTSQPCSYEDQQCGNNVTLVIPFEFSWTKTFTLVLETMCENQTSVDRCLYSGSLLPGETGLAVSHNTDVIRLTYVISVSCSKHYYSPSCSKLCRPRHDDFGHYICNNDGDKVCMDGWTGENCHIAVCKTGCHGVHGSCDRPGECRCAFGWQGPLCDECRPYPGCRHGSCQGSPWQCVCDLHWGGILCDKDLNPCGRDIYPCENGGVCENILPGQYRCVCPPLYTGKHCKIVMSGCLTDGCENAGTCVIMDTGGYCQCQPGWTGHTCQTEVNECSSSPCKHGLCTDQFNSFQCVCESGWQGSLCHVDSNECLDHPCMNAIQCHNHVGGYSCECLEGWTGKNCQINMDECTAESCLNGGTCVDTIDGYICACPAGFHGESCESDVDECSSRPCYHGGDCQNSVGGYMCDCVVGYTGEQCQTVIDPCLSSPCHVTSTCVNVAEGYHCLCAPPYTGRQCTERVQVVPCGAEGCSGLSCSVDGDVHNDGDTWSHDCNTCTCHHGDIVCTQIVCGPRNCIIHPNQTENRYFCEENKTCVQNYDQPCLTKPCFPWGMCDQPPQPHVSWYNSIHITLSLNMTLFPKGVYLESLCSDVRKLPSLVSVSYHMTVNVTCLLSGADNVKVTIGTRLSSDAEQLQEVSNDVIQEILSNNSTLRSVTFIHVHQPVTTRRNSETAWPVLISCAVLVAFGLVSILLLILCYSHRHTHLKHSPSQHQALIGPHSTVATTATVSRHRNPVYNPILDSGYLKIKGDKEISDLESNEDNFKLDNCSNVYSNLDGEMYDLKKLVQSRLISHGQFYEESKNNYPGNYGKNENIQTESNKYHFATRENSADNNENCCTSYGSNNDFNFQRSHVHSKTGHRGSHSNDCEENHMNNLTEDNYENCYPSRENYFEHNPEDTEVNSQGHSYNFRDCQYENEFKKSPNKKCININIESIVPVKNDSESPSSKDINICVETNVKSTFQT